MRLNSLKRLENHTIAKIAEIAEIAKIAKIA